MEIRRLERGDDHRVRALAHLFDGPANDEATHRFLGEEGHYLLVAYEGDHPAGFITGIEMTHPDKGTEMFMYELAVDGPFRRQGIGSALVERLGQLARSRGCYGMWVVTDQTNEAALATYTGSGGIPERGQTVLVWTF